MWNLSSELCSLFLSAAVSLPYKQEDFIDKIHIVRKYSLRNVVKDILISVDSKHLTGVRLDDNSQLKMAHSSIN